MTETIICNCNTANLSFIVTSRKLRATKISNVFPRSGSPVQANIQLLQDSLPIHIHYNRARNNWWAPQADREKAGLSQLVAHQGQQSIGALEKHSRVSGFLIRHSCV
jgi:hypothetical protein